MFNEAGNFLTAEWVAKRKLCNKGNSKLIGPHSAINSRNIGVCQPASFEQYSHSVQSGGGLCGASKENTGVRLRL